MGYTQVVTIVEEVSHFSKKSNIKTINRLFSNLRYGEILRDTFSKIQWRVYYHFESV